MAARGFSRARPRVLRRLTTCTGLTVLLSAAAFPALAGPAAAAEHVVTVAADQTVGPVAAEVGDVITIVGENVTVNDLKVPGHRPLPVVVATTVPDPTSVPCDTSGRKDVPITFTYGSVVSPTDSGVPEADVLNALAAIPIPPATLQVEVAAVEPPPPPPPAPAPAPAPAPPPPPPLPLPPPVVPGLAVDSPVVAPPSPRGTEPRWPTTGDEDRVVEQPSDLPAALAGTLAVPAIPVTNAAPQSAPSRSDDGLSVLDALGGFDTQASLGSTSASIALDAIPMALGVPSLLAMMSICVLAAGVGRLQFRPYRVRR